MYDPAENKWVTRNPNDGNRYLYNWSAAIDPGRRIMLATGGKQRHQATYMWDLKLWRPAMQQLATRGDKEIESAQNPGLLYDPILRSFVAWKSGTDIYTLDLQSLEWKRQAAAETNEVNPGKPAVNGTYGRFRYSSKYHVYILVNSVDRNVYIYRMSDNPQE